MKRKDGLRSLLKCPCCGEHRRESEYPTFIAQLSREISSKQYVDFKGSIIGNVYWIDAKKGIVDCACDICIKFGRAIRADIKKQLFCDFAPHFAYFNKNFTCRDCGTLFLFSKEEQQHYYETLQFWVQAKRVRCNNCQIAKRLRDRLSRLLADNNYNDLDKIKEIVEIRLVQKQYKQARMFLSHTTGHFDKRSIRFLLVESLLTQIREAEK